MTGMLDFVIILFGMSSAFMCYRKAKEAEKKGESGTSSFYVLVAVLIMINVIYVLLMHYRLFPRP
jgi:hypothetical protein